MIYVNTKNKSNLYLDFDGVVFDSIKRICDMYNQHHRYFRDYTPAISAEITQYDFSDICPLASHEILMSYFDSPEFFNVDGRGGYYWMTYAESNRLMSTKQYIEAISDDYHIIFATIGSISNLRGKQLFLAKNFPYADFIGVDAATAKDKSEIDMSDGIQVDDEIRMLKTSNAKTKILFGKGYPWQPEPTSEEIKRCRTWDQLYYNLKERGIHER